MSAVMTRRDFEIAKQYMRAGANWDEAKELLFSEPGRPDRYAADLGELSEEDEERGYLPPLDDDESDQPAGEMTKEQYDAAMRYMRETGKSWDEAMQYAMDQVQPISQAQPVGGAVPEALSPRVKYSARELHGWLDDGHLERDGLWLSPRRMLGVSASKVNGPAVGPVLYSADADFPTDTSPWYRDGERVPTNERREWNGLELPQHPAERRKKIQDAIARCHEAEARDGIPFDVAMRCLGQAEAEGISFDTALERAVEKQKNCRLFGHGGYTAGGMYYPRD